MSHLNHISFIIIGFYCGFYELPHTLFCFSVFVRIYDSNKVSDFTTTFVFSKVASLAKQPAYGLSLKRLTFWKCAY